MLRSSLIFIAFNFTLAVFGNNFEDFDDQDESTPICSSVKCTCNFTSKISSCSGLIFEYLPLFPIWTEILILNGNHLTLLRDNAFDGLTRLKSLYMSSNDLEYIESGAFRGLDRLTTLDLSNNRLYYWPSDTFRPLVKLSNLNLSGNAFDDVTVFTKLLPIGPNRLDRLVIGKNRFVRKSADFVRLPPAAKLDLSGSKFQSINGRILTLMGGGGAGNSNLTVRMDSLGQSDELDLFDCGALFDSAFFDSVHSVLDLNIGRNRVKDIVPILSKLKTFPRLENLNMSGLKMDNEISKWDVYPKLIKSLDLSSLGLKSISFDPFEKSESKLITLFASNNQIGNIHFPKSLASLRKLRLDGNRLVDFPTVETGVKLENLEYFDLSNNQLTRIDSESLSVFPNLQILSVSKNRIVQIHPSSFTLCCSKTLLKLDLSYNSMENLPLLALKSLRSLHLSHNRLRNIENGTLYNNPHLTIFDISHNPDLMSDSTLFLCDDQENDQEKNRFRFHFIDRCSDSSVSAWIDDLTALGKLKRLEARGVGLSSFPRLQFAKLAARLEYLDLSENFIDTDGWESMASTIPKKSCLQIINLRRNRLIALKNLTIFANGCLRRVDLSENPFKCDCHLESVYALLKSLPNSEMDVYNESLYYCFSESTYYRYPMYEYATNSQPCIYTDSNQSIPSANAVRIILAIFLSLVVLVLVSVFFRTSLATMIRYGFNIRQRMYKPLRVIITGNNSGDRDTASPVML